MARVKFIKDYKNYRVGDIAEVSPNVAFGLTDRGVAKVTKDMSVHDYKVKRGNTKRQRPYNFSRR